MQYNLAVLVAIYFILCMRRTYVEIAKYIIMFQMFGQFCSNVIRLEQNANDKFWFEMSKNGLQFRMEIPKS